MDPLTQLGSALGLLYFSKNMAIVASLYHCLIWIFVIKRVLYYTSEVGQRSQYNNIINAALKFVNDRKAISVGGHTANSGQKIPHFIIGFKPFFIMVSNIRFNEYYGRPNVMIFIYVPRWLIRNDFYLMIEKDCESDTDKGTSNDIRVMEATNNSVRNPTMSIFHQVALDEKIPKDCLEVCKKVTEEIIKLYRSGSEKGMVVMLQGSPGTGKSITARSVALQLDAVLYPSYDPTFLGHCLWARKQELSGVDHFVVVFEEMDVGFAKVVAGSVEDSGNDTCRDVTNKSSWNNWLDRINRQKKLILVLTTNKTDAELLEISGGDESMLRDGRVTRRFNFAAMQGSQGYTPPPHAVHDPLSPPLSPQSPPLKSKLAHSPSHDLIVIHEQGAKGKTKTD